MLLIVAAFRHVGHDKRRQARGGQPGAAEFQFDVERGGLSAQPVTADRNALKDTLWRGSLLLGTLALPFNKTDRLLRVVYQRLAPRPFMARSTPSTTWRMAFASRAKISPNLEPFMWKSNLILAGC
jgi:hypothetical protein